MSSAERSPTEVFLKSPLSRLDDDRKTFENADKTRAKEIMDNCHLSPFPKVIMAGPAPELQNSPVFSPSFP